MRAVEQDQNTAYAKNAHLCILSNEDYILSWTSLQLEAISNMFEPRHFIQWESDHKVRNVHVFCLPTMSFRWIKG